MINNKTFSVFNKEGLRFNLVLICEGDSYGLDNCLTHDEVNKPMVEFYDARYPHTEHGQFVSRYYVASLDGTCQFSNGYPINMVGLCLDGGVDPWAIDANAGEQVLRWLKSTLNEEA